MPYRTPILLILALAALAGVARTQAKLHAYVGARIIPVAGDEIPEGVLIVRGDKILAVGPVGETPIPPEALRHEVEGVIMPGLVDTHSHIGGGSGGDPSQPIQPDCRIYDAINMRDPSFAKARAGGVTTVNIMPGSGHLLSGQTIYLKLRRGATIDDLVIRGAGGWAMGGIKMANGTNSLRKPPFPGTRAKSAALVRQQYVKAIEYREKIRAAGDDPSKRPPRDIGLDALVEALEGKRLVHHHTHRHDDIVTVLRLAEEFGLRVVLHHVSEGWMVAKEIAAAKVPCSIILIDSPGGKLEAVNLELKTGAVLEKAGVLTSIHTDDGITDSRLFLRSAAFAMRGGMSRSKALEAVTLAGAEMLDLGDRVGSLEPGKDADFILLSGDPFSVYTKVLGTWIEGRRVFDRGNPSDRLYAVGGYGASDGQTWYLCCQGGHSSEETNE